MEKFKYIAGILYLIWFRVFHKDMWKQLIDDCQKAEQKRQWFLKCGIDRPIGYYLEQIDEI